MPNNPPIPGPVADPPNTLWGTTLHYNTQNVVGSASGGGGNYLPLTGGTVTGWTNFNGGLQFLDGIYAYPSSSSSSAGIVAGNFAQATRWVINLCDYTAETGGNTGSNFSIVKSNDDGSQQNVITINRATGIASFVNGINLPATTNAAPADGDLWYDGTHLNFHHGGTTTAIV